MNNNAHDKAAQEEHFADIFARLREQDIEQFYAHYQLWVLRRRVPLIENQLETLREHLAENQQATEGLRPSALALAVLVRLQSNGVSDTDVLDLMLDRGEDWLDCMMQRLDYCEQVEDFIQGDYTQWCIKSLEGAYDWIDSLLGSIKEDGGHRESFGRDDEATEALLLQKLRQDDEEAMMEVTLEQPEAEAATESHETIAADALPTSEHEPTTLANAQVSALDEQSETLSQSELLPQSSETAESQESSELEQQPELIGWKDLEDLEAPGEPPVPWYSIDVTEDGATFAPNGARPAATMDDWIKILHADTVASKEANETEEATDFAAEPSISADRAETVETGAQVTTPDSETTEVPKERINTTANNAEVTEQEPGTEAQNAPEALSPAKVDQEQSTLASEELQAEEISSDESAILMNETPVTEVSFAEEASLLAENVTIERNHDEIKLDQATDADTGRDEHKVAEENAEQFASERANHREESEEAASEQEDNVSKPLEESREEAQTLAEEGVAGFGEAESYQAQPFPGDLTQAELVEAEGAKIELFAGDVEQTEAYETQTSTSDLPLSESVSAERPEAQIFTEEATEAVQARDEQTESPQPQAEEILLSPNSPGEQPELQETDHARKTEKETRGNEIEAAAIVNDILSEEEEQGEQLAWYEYLDLEEPANDVINSTAEEHIEPEKVEASSPDEPTIGETATPEIYEYAVVEESEDEQTLIPPPEGRVIEEVVESENWQSWNASEADEETLPLALKEIQRAQEALVNNAPESTTSEVMELRAEIQNEDAETHASHIIMEDSSPTAQSGRTESEASAVAEDANRNIAEQTAVLQDPPQKKLGFWRRLFSFGRKKKR